MTAKNIEIMSPVGSYESLMAAIQGGAGSIYFGVGKLNMRSKSSKNFDLEDLAKITAICEENNVLSYLALNTIIYDHEMVEMRSLVNAAKANNISAIIATDMSVIQYARELGVEVHMSTQTNVTNVEDVRFYSQWADVMVTARELSLDQVAYITEQIKKQQIRGPHGELVKIEIFVHGALCMAISGKCYLSLHTMNSSANRGACLQPCRRSYEVNDKEGEFSYEIDNEYIMSPKDLNTLELLDKILLAGVTILKIEGRGRSADYVKTVTLVYNEAVKAYFDGEFSKEKIVQWNNRLQSVYNRGFWEGYYMGREMGEWTERYGSQASQKKIFLGKVKNYFSKLNVAEIQMETNDISIGEHIRIIGETTGVYDDEKVEEIRVDLKPVKKTSKGDTFSIQTKEIVRRGDKVYKVVMVEERF
jgi:putative protease